MQEKVSIYRPDDCYDEMKYQLEHGRIKGTTTHNKDIDECWTWRKNESNIWTGYANEGKSLLFKQFSIAKALNDNWRFAVSAPEDFPAVEYYDDMIHTIAGQTTDKDYPNVISSKLYDEIFDLIRDKFIFVYIKPPKNTLQLVFNEFKELCAKEQIDACLIDPILKFAWPEDIPDNYERYASYVGALSVDFCRDTNTSLHIVMHQITPTFDNVKIGGEDKKKYAEPSMYRVKGGGSWADGFDNVLSVWRPNYAFDKVDTEVQFSSQKIKKQKLTGIPQRLRIRFNRRTNRYTEFDTDKDLFNFDKFLK